MHYNFGTSSGKTIEESKEGTETVFLFAETMMESLRHRSGVNPNARISTAIFEDDKKLIKFYFTHQAQIDPSLSDTDAVIAALGDSAEYWASSPLNTYTHTIRTDSKHR